MAIQYDDVKKMGLARLYARAWEIIAVEGLGASMLYREEIATRERVLLNRTNDQSLLMELQDSEANLVKRLGTVRQSITDLSHVAMERLNGAQTSKAAVRCEAVTTDNGCDL